MLIGLIAPPWVSVPPRGYGGTETVVDNLARGLSGLGHEVRLFTLGESCCPVRRSWLYRSAPAAMGGTVDEAAHVLAAYDELGDVDVLHDHTVLGPLLQAARAGAGAAPVVTTHHGPFDARNLRIFREIGKHAAVVAISHDQARHAADVPITSVIHHGIDLDTFRLGAGNGGYLLFLGRMSPDKGVHRAVRVAHATGMPLRIATKMREAAEREYYRQVVRPLLSSSDEVIVEPGLDVRGALLEDATAVLNPIDWPEPFGLVMAEALASGTPVLAFPHGAAPEIIEDGRTGFLCTDEADMAARVARIGELDRAECRRSVERRFSLERMSLDYANLYARLLDSRSRERRDIVPASGNPRRMLTSGPTAAHRNHVTHINSGAAR